MKKRKDIDVSIIHEVEVYSHEDKKDEEGKLLSCK